MKHTRLLVVSVITCILFLIPFGWLKDGQVDFGGDSSRLYFYQPLEYLKNQSLYSVSKSGLGGENYSYYALPHFLLLSVVTLVTTNPTMTIAAFYGLTLSLAFLFTFLSIKELLSDLVRRDYVTFVAAIIAGLYYILPPQLNTGWRHVILTFYQVFLNPLLFFMLLRYFITRNFRYMAVSLIVTVLFSPNFSYVGSPPFFAFFPMSLLFLILYTKYVRKLPIPVKGLLVGLVLFSLLHLFHMLPIVRGLFYPHSANAADLFSNQAKLDRGLGYFTGIAGSIRVSLHLMGLAQLSQPPWYAWTMIIFPAVLVVGSLKNSRKTYLLSTLFFLVALYWVSAKITNMGFELYKALFYIPGFSMFRNFYGQWGPLFLFFYALLLGQAYANLASTLRRKGVIFLVSLCAIILLVVPAIPFLQGDILQKGLHWQSYNVKSIFVMDPAYEETLTFIRSMPSDGKFLLLPLTDPGYQVIAGMDAGAYEGPSTIAYLSNKQDFSGYQELGVYKDLVAGSIRMGDTAFFERLLATLGVRYIFYNADTNIYDTKFPYQPYSYMRNFFPEDQSLYKQLISKLDLELMYSKNDTYFVYKLNHPQYLPEVYLADSTTYVDRLLDDRTERELLPLVRGQRSAIFEYKYRPQQTNDTYHLAVPESVYAQVLKNPEPPRLLHHSFVTTPPGAYVYPLIMLREELSLTRLTKRSRDEQIDRRLFLSAKRILEMEKWGNDMSLGMTIKTQEDIRLAAAKTRSRGYFLTKTNNWEVSIGRYVRYFEEAIDKIREADPTSAWAISQKFIITEYLLQHRARLEKEIPYLSKSTEEKAYLASTIDLVFEYLHGLVDYRLPDPTQITYRIAPNEPGTEDSRLLVEDTFDDSSPVHIAYENRVQAGTPSSQSSGWLDFGTLEMKMQGDQDARFALEFGTLNNLMNSAERTNITTIRQSSESSALTIDTSLISGKGGLIWNIPHWKPERFYLLSFEYRTEHAPFDVRLVDEEVRGSSVRDTRVLLENMLSAHNWQRYQAVVKSSLYANTALLQFSGSSVDVPISNLEIRRPALYEIPHPIILTQLTHRTVSSESSPSLEVQKVNPSFYRIRVGNPDGQPITVVLNEKFSEQWRLKQKDGTLIPHTNHFEVNKYANAWYLDPKQFKDAKSLDLILDTEPQQIFYTGLVVSTLALIVTLYFVIRPLRT